ncbi:PD-(D/E)XK nuclease family protein [Lysinibacillus sp. BW-2-10]|uniref:PD-(D/E)XK nuclease family protein n=1 Tax=Lysinibacillus sp. BW-2-10 TaxID=2590030 RepID=UPI00117D67BF|nr:PD-(D/E)XK nuclease family protein [Lysinibacillus sp. BW-2-10]TSI02538.1 PD-(D/E)XK nuclease family protein [Lysinibacillus sp. BW-2-10]
MQQIETVNQTKSLINKAVEQTINSWSFSKHKRFLNCRRGFVFTDVVARIGKRKDATVFEKKVNQLNKMTNINMLFGSILHEQIYRAVKEWFREGMKPNAELMYRGIREELNRTFIDSKSNRERWRQGNGDGIMLQEIYYANQLSHEQTEKVKDKLYTCPTAFCESSTLEEIMTGTNIRFDHAERNRTMIIDNIRVRFSMDLVYDDKGNGKKSLIDWKTGSRSADDFFQLCLYALYYVHVFKIDVERLSIVNEYLYAIDKNEQNKRYPINMDDIERMKDFVTYNVENIAYFLTNENLERAEDVLLLLETQNEKSCNWCNFREICQDDLL